MTIVLDLQQVIPAELTKRLHEGRLILFVGAGVSRAVTDSNGKPLFPSWPELLKHAADRIDTEGNYSKLVRAFLEAVPCNYLEAAKYAQQGLGPLWADFLKGHIDRKYEDVDQDSLELARAIWGIGSSLIITTNYDNVLRWACPDQMNLEAWDIQATAEQVRLLQGKLSRKTIWHLHGRIDNAANIILAPDGFNRLYPANGIQEPEFNTALTTLHNAIAGYSLLFIGYSMDDAAVVEQLVKIDEVYQRLTGPHYLLLGSRKNKWSICRGSGHGAPWGCRTLFLWQV